GGAPPTGLCGGPLRPWWVIRCPPGPNQGLSKLPRGPAGKKIDDADRSPLTPHKRHKSGHFLTAASCHERTRALQQTRRIVGYSISSSALASSLRGIVRPTARAVLRLINR